MQQTGERMIGSGECVAQGPLVRWLSGKNGRGVPRCSLCPALALTCSRLNHVHWAGKGRMEIS